MSVSVVPATRDWPRPLVGPAMAWSLDAGDRNVSEHGKAASSTRLPDVLGGEAVLDLRLRPPPRMLERALIPTHPLPIIFFLGPLVWIIGTLLRRQNWEVAIAHDGREDVCLFRSLREAQSAKRRLVNAGAGIAVNRPLWLPFHLSLPASAVLLVVPPRSRVLDLGAAAILGAIISAGLIALSARHWRRMATNVANARDERHLVWLSVAAVTTAVALSALGGEFLGGIMPFVAALIIGGRSFVEVVTSRCRPIGLEKPKRILRDAFG